MKNNTDKPVSVQPLVDVVKALRAPNGCPWDQNRLMNRCVDISLKKLMK